MLPAALDRIYRIFMINRILLGLILQTFGKMGSGRDLLHFLLKEVWETLGKLKLGKLKAVSCG